MKMSISFLDKVLDIVPGRITILSVENSKLYGNLIQAFYSSMNSDYDPSVLIEVNDYDDLVSSVEYMKDNKLYPF